MEEPSGGVEEPRGRGGEERRKKIMFGVAPKAPRPFSPKMHFYS